ncbi:MAG: helix-turn-helix transcriptional regulator [Clostridia bacterium]|nr:helix-turn-helix transcriptional regulator [Clostridia bacterium]
MIAHIDFEAVGCFVRTFRHQANMTQEQLAEKIGMSTNFVGNIERGVSTPSATTLFRIALALNITMQDLLNEHTLIWREDTEPSTLRSPSTVFCNTLSDWLLKTEEEAFADDPAAPASPIDLASIGFLMLDEDFPSDHGS